MSKISFFALRDVKVDAFVMPFCAGSPAAASRALSMMLDPHSVYAMYPADFVLYHLADVDVDSGRVVPMSEPEYVCGLASIVRGHFGAGSDVSDAVQPIEDLKEENPDGEDKKSV
jgi:hypothetical protein